MKNAVDDGKRRIAQALEESRWALKELKRQAPKPIELDPGTRQLAEEIKRVTGGEEPRLGLDRLENELDAAEERMRKEAESAGDIKTVTTIERGREAEQFGMLAGVLARDANRAAAEGILEEDWIHKVLVGHRGDTRLQRACLERILLLWESGPWPWLREK
jgi:hypothetical protein